MKRLILLALLLFPAPLAAQIPDTLSVEAVRARSSYLLGSARSVVTHAEIIRAQLDSLLARPQRVDTVFVVDTVYVTAPAPEPPDTVQPEPSAAYTPPASIDATGAANVTGALNAWLASVPDSSVIRFPAGARYRIEGTLLIQDRHGLTIEGGGAEFFATVTAPEGLDWTATRSRSHWKIHGGSGITLREIVVRGANPNGGQAAEAYNSNYEAQHGIDVWGVQGLELDRVSVTDVWGDCFYISNDRTTGEWSRDVWVHDSYCARNGRQGFAIDGSERVLIEGSRMEDTRRASIDLEPYNAASGMRDITIRGNAFGPTRLFWLAAGSTSAALIEDVTVEGNRLVGQEMNVMVRSPDRHPEIRHRNIRLIGNTSDKAFGSPVAMIRFGGIDGLEIRGNVAPVAATQSRKAVEVTESCGVVIEDNEFPGALREGEAVPYAACNE